MESSWDSTKERIRSLVFRFWTACVVLVGYGYAWIYYPELLTWWKRSTTSVIEGGCALLPYPWGDRIEATLGNFGLWVQITLAIVAFRVLVWLVTLPIRRSWNRRRPDPGLSLRIAAEDRAAAKRDGI